MTALRTLIARADGEGVEGDAILWTAESLGLVAVVRYLANGRVRWVRTEAGTRWARERWAGAA